MITSVQYYLHYSNSRVLSTQKGVVTSYQESKAIYQADPKIKRAGKGAIPVTGQGEVEQRSGSREYRLRCLVRFDAGSERSSSDTSILVAYTEPQSAGVVQHQSTQRCIAPSALRCFRSQPLGDRAVPRPVTLVRPARSAFMIP